MITWFFDDPTMCYNAEHEFGKVIFTMGKQEFKAVN